MAVTYTSYVPATAPRFGDVALRTPGTGQATWTPNFLTAPKMPPDIAQLSGGAVNTGYISLGGIVTGSGGGGGTVTSVGLAAPVEFTVSGSPVTGSGTLTLTKATEPANQVWAGPTSGAAAAPSFRSLASSDLPSSPAFGGNPQAPVLWIAFTLAANLVAPSDNRTHIPGELSIPSGLLVDLSATTGHTLLEVW